MTINGGTDACAYHTRVKKNPEATMAAARAQYARRHGMYATRLTPTHSDSADRTIAVARESSQQLYKPVRSAGAKMSFVNRAGTKRQHTKKRPPRAPACTSSSLEPPTRTPARHTRIAATTPYRTPPIQQLNLNGGLARTESCAVNALRACDERPRSGRTTTYARKRASHVGYYYCYRAFEP